LDILRNNLAQELLEILNDIKEAKGLLIKSDTIEEKVLNEENDSENPTLFVRINSAGTTLTGDDLIYSIYKATFPEAKNLIENIGVNFLAPTQVLSLVSRIVTSELEDNNFVKKLNVRDFQRRIKKDIFKERLKTLIQTEQIESLFKKALSIMSCKDNRLFEGEIPPIIIKQFIKKHQDLFLFLLYWLHLNFDKVILDEKLKLNIVSKLLCFAWFDFGNIPRLWNEKIKNEYFWDEPLNELIWWNGEDGIDFPISPALLRQYYEQDEIMNMFKDNKEDKWGLVQNGVGNGIIKFYNSLKVQEFELPKGKEFFRRFIGKIRHNKQMVLLAQREYINETFGDFNQMDEIEDTNVPWDWDHIYPDSWVYNMKDCEQIIRDWNWTNGNLRAISLEQNRSESNNNSPKDRLEDEAIRKLSFVFENDWKFWQEIDNRIRDKDKAILHFKATTTRLINIYEKFWHDLKIHDLIIEN